MNDELFKEVLEEILTENKEINKQLSSLKAEIGKPNSDKDEVLEKLKKIKVHEQLQEIRNCLYNSKIEINDSVKSGITNLVEERKIFVHVATSWKRAIIRFFNISVICGAVYLIVLLIGKYYMPVVRDNLKFRNAFEYVYYENTEAQDYLQELILDFDNKKVKRQRIKETNERKAQSPNPLVTS